MFQTLRAIGALSALLWSLVLDADDSTSGSSGGSSAGGSDSSGDSSSGDSSSSDSSGGDSGSSSGTDPRKQPKHSDVDVDKFKGAARTEGRTARETELLNQFKQFGVNSLDDVTTILKQQQQAAQGEDPLKAANEEIATLRRTQVESEVKLALLEAGAPRKRIRKILNDPDLALPTTQDGRIDDAAVEAYVTSAKAEWPEIFGTSTKKDGDGKSGDGQQDGQQDTGSGSSGDDGETELTKSLRNIPNGPPDTGKQGGGEQQKNPAHAYLDKAYGPRDTQGQGQQT